MECLKHASYVNMNQAMAHRNRKLLYCILVLSHVQTRYLCLHEGCVSKIKFKMEFQNNKIQEPTAYIAEKHTRLTEWEQMQPVIRGYK